MISNEVDEVIVKINMEDITDANYAHVKRVCKNFEINNLGEYLRLYVQSDTLLLAEIFGIL